MKGKIYLAFLVVALLAVSSIFTLGMVAADEGDNTWKVDVEEGTTDRFGGGAYRYFRFSNDAGTDAMFGVIWGTEDNPNSIVMVSTQARYLARVQVQMEGGFGNQEKQQKQEQKFAKINSILGTTIGKIYEYNDENGNGVVNFALNEQGQMTSRLEEVFKYVDLRDANWTSSELIEEKVEDNTTWEFTLTARDLKYQAPMFSSLSPGMEDEVLDYVNFTFHLTAGTRVVKDVEMPSFDVRVRKGFGNRYILKDANNNGTTKVDGIVGDYDMKWDHEFQGWDFEEDNQNPMLVMSFHNMYGNQYPDAAHRWQWRFMHQMQNDEGVKFRDQEGKHVTNFSEQVHYTERKLRQNRIEYGGEWSRVGRFRWESNVTVDGEQTKMNAQVIFGAPMVHIGPFTRNFVGFQVWGGLNYPGGEHIYHDPAQSGSAFLEVSDNIEGPGGSEGPAGLLGRPIFVIFMVGLALVLIITLLYRRGDKSNQRDRYDRETSTEKEDWSDYYDRGS